MQRLLVSAVTAVGGLLSFDTVDTAGRVLGEGIWLALPERRRMAVRQAAERLGVDEAEAQRIVRRSYASICASALEIFINHKLGPQCIKERIHVLTPHLWRGLAEDSSRPSVAVTGHLGAWEQLSGVFQYEFHRAPRQVVARRHRNTAINDAMTRLRSKPDVEVVDHRQASSRVLQGLRQNGVAAFLVDHNAMRKDAIFLPFLGKVAAVNRGPALLAVRSRAKIWPMCMIRLGKGRYELHSREPLDTAKLSGSVSERVQASAEFYTKAMEEWVLQFPDQWLWMHKRWKTRPPGEEA